MAESKIVEAAMSSATTGAIGRPISSNVIQDAMNAAILECAAKGITDPKKVKAAMMAARAEVKRRAAAPDIEKQEDGE